MKRGAGVELRDLSSFIAVVDQGSYAKAASELGYAQSTITAHIKQLESDLGRPLFERVGRRMILTEYGHAVVGIARDMLRSAERMSAAAAPTARMTGTVRVDVAETILSYLLGPVIREFRDRAPEVRLRLRNRTCLQVSDSLRSGTCDIGLTYAMDWTPELFSYETLGTTELVLVGSSDLAGYDLTIPDQRIAAPFVTDEPDSAIRRLFERYLVEKRIAFEEPLELWSTQAIKRCVSSGLGCTVLPRFAAEGELASEDLVELRWDGANERIPLYCATRRAHVLMPAEELFVDIVRARIAPLLADGAIDSR